MSTETYENTLYDSEVDLKLKEAEIEIKSNTPRKTHEEVFGELYAMYKISDAK